MSDRDLTSRVGVAAAAITVCFALSAAACMPARTGGEMQRDNPLGPSFWIIPTPSDDDGLLGRSFTRPPDTGLTLEEQSQPNPCADKLAAAKDAAMGNKYENAIDVRSSASGGALLGLYGFSADVSKATHLVYKVSTAKRLSRLDTSEYVECCKQKSCGWGYVSALVYGEGDYVSGAETAAKAEGHYTVVTGKGETSFKVLNKRQIKGYVAAVLTAHDRGAAAQACPPGETWGATECVPNERVEQARMACRGQLPGMGAMPAEEAESPDFKQLAAQQQQQACMWLDMHKLPH
jgi:hypothetical protein